MFKNLADFSVQRTILQAFGFYLVSLAVGVLLTAGIATALAHLNRIIILSKGPDFKDNLNAGMATVQYLLGPKLLVTLRILVSVSLGLAVIRAKKSYTLAAFSGIAAAAGLASVNGFLSFIPIAFMTMLPKKQ